MNANLQAAPEPRAPVIPLEKVNALELFTGGALDDLLEMIEAEAMSHAPDLSTATGRKAVASTAYKVSRSKTTIDSAGKDLVAGWKAQAKEVDQSRKRAREFLDNLRDRVRAPLNEWEEAEKAREAAEKLAAEVEAAHEEAIQLDAIWEREQEVARREAELKRQEEERIREENERRAVAEAKEREERIRREAEERAQREAQEKIELEKRRRERAEQDAEEAARRERERIQREADQKAEAERLRAADEAHRLSVLSTAAESLIDDGIEPAIAKQVIDLIASGRIPCVSVSF